ncbi:MAG: hypothetical protein NVS9B13_22790 [Candidatus Acidiferrum sp.]
MVAVISAALTLATFAQGGSVHGTVLNKTTGKPAAGVEVILIQLQGGMQPVANSKSDAKGNFTFEHPAIGAQPMLVRAVYHGVNFHAPLRPGGQSNAEVDIYELSKDPRTISVSGHVIIFQPSGSSLLVGEEYSIQNNSAPPQAYYRTEGDFDFSIPDKAQLQQVAATGPAGMPVVQTQIERGNDRYGIAYAFRPGETNIRLSYELPYTGNAASLNIPTLYSGARLLVVAPPGVQVSGDGLQPAGQEQGMNIFTHEPLAEKTFLSVNLAGTAAATAGPDAGAQSSQGAPQQGNSRTESANVQAIPGRLDVLKWPLLGGFAVLFAMGALLLWRRPVVAMAPAAPPDASSTYQATPAMPPTVGNSSPLAMIDAQVSGSMDSLKDTIFRLELRRQAGTISEEEYARERAKTEKLLRDLVRG